jgi:DNA (cytosine-5)-methyltransferase 1
MPKRRPLLLDLFCGAGGCAMGYHRAGFDVVGVDIKPQKNYLCSGAIGFIQADAIDILNHLVLYPHDGLYDNNNRGYVLDCFDLIHASPPCQAYSRCRRIGNSRPTQDLVAPIRRLLKKAAKPYVIENVEGSPLHFPTLLCGKMLGLKTRRHRLFESSILLLAPKACNHQPGDIIVFGHSVELIGSKTTPYKDASGRIHYRRQRLPLSSGNKAMGIDWMNRAEISQAIPPAYTEYLGRQLIRAIEQGKASC